MTSNAALNRRSFLAHSAALAPVPAVATLAAGAVAAPATANAYAWKHFIGGHMGRLGTRADMPCTSSTWATSSTTSRRRWPRSNPTPFFARYGNNS
jgi:hypothetical protein